jgi:hypothetical protein
MLLQICLLHFLKFPVNIFAIFLTNCYIVLMTDWQRLKAAEKWDVDDLPEAFQPQPDVPATELPRPALRDTRHDLSLQIRTHFGCLGVVPPPQYVRE